jgi:hypothetical protein
MDSGQATLPVPLVLAIKSSNKNEIYVNEDPNLFSSIAFVNWRCSRSVNAKAKTRTSELASLNW